MSEPFLAEIRIVGFNHEKMPLNSSFGIHHQSPTRKIITEDILSFIALTTITMFSLTANALMI